MPTNLNKLSRFWQELKRRRVVHVITVYASATFVIIELINNLAEPFSLPSNLLTIVVIVLAVGFPLAIILSWLYDLTSEGVEKTKPIEEVEESEKTGIPNAWKIATYVSFVVIVGLVVLNIVGGGKQLRAGDIQSLLILPFINYTGDEQLDIFVSGMHRELILDVGRISKIKVISKTTSDVYKDGDMTIPQIATERKVDALVETSFLCWGDTICFQMNVVTPDEELLWAAEYKEDKSQIQNLFNNITKQIADEIKIELTPEEERLLAKSRTVDREAFDAFLKSQICIGDVSEESLNKALEYLNSGIEKDPDWAPLYFALAEVWRGIQQLGYEPPEIARPKIYENFNKALELDPNSADAYFNTANIAVWVEWNWNKGEEDFLKALALNPNDALTRMWYAHLLYYLQRPDEASIQAQLAFDLDPLNPFIQTMFSLALLYAGESETAMELLEEILAFEPEHAIANSIIEKAAFQCGDYGKVIEVAKYHIPIKEDAFQEIERIYEEQGFMAAYEEILRQLEVLMLNEFIINPVTLASKYHMVHQYDKAMDWIEKGFEKHDQNMPAMATRYYNLIHLYDNPRFIDIVNKMNLPLPNN